MFGRFLGFGPLEARTLEIQGVGPYGFDVYLDRDVLPRFGAALMETKLKGKFTHANRPGVLRLLLTDVGGMTAHEVVAEMHKLLIGFFGPAPLTYELDEADRRYVRWPDGSVQVRGNVNLSVPNDETPSTTNPALEFLTRYLLVVGEPTEHAWCGAPVTSTYGGGCENCQLSWKFVAAKADAFGAPLEVVAEELRRLFPDLIFVGTVHHSSEGNLEIVELYMPELNR